MKSWPNLKGKGSSGGGKAVLGIDPGVARMGYGAVVQEGGRLQALEYGTLTTKAHVPLEIRLAELFLGLQKIINRVKPRVVAVEELFFSKNVKTAIAVGQARGVALLACGLVNVPVFEYKPLVVKQAVAGHGGADKQQIQKMVKLFLGLAEVPKPDDTADALALAITHIQCAGTHLSETLRKLSRETGGAGFIKPLGERST
jgi:crossover junction endodeoxyribonuclease RuvC